MSVTDRVFNGIRTIMLLEEKVRVLDASLAETRVQIGRDFADHEKRLVRLETIVEIARPDGAVLRIAPRAADD